METFYTDAAKDGYQGGDVSTPGFYMLNFDKLTGEEYEFILVNIEGPDREKDLQVSKEWVVELTYGVGKEPQI
ncbi:hypothetical protein [Paenibacillus sp. NPDC058071]|uniref:hypothetical protein n=1 Tax=Paenibacillus sp. NPDC058071 TaxID=3346326 RepID=UPI0036DBFC49